jgi:hypothetical protein
MELEGSVSQSFMSDEIHTFSHAAVVTEILMGRFSLLLGSSKVDCFLCVL